MLEKYYKATYSFIKKENMSYRAICAVLLIIILILTAIIYRSRETVVLIPPHLNDKVKVSLNRADQKYLETWALSFALLIGNVTPKNIGFVIESFQQYLSPEMYQELSKDIFAQADSLKQGNVSTSFEPRNIEYDEKNQHVKVKGQLVMYGILGKSLCSPKTYEFGIQIENYFPKINYFDSYSVKPEKEEKPNVKQKAKNQSSK